MREVVLYSLPASVCVACRGTEIMLRRKGVEARKVRVDLDAEALEFIKSLGYTQAPVVVIYEDGEMVEHFGGFSSERIEELVA